MDGIRKRNPYKDSDDSADLEVDKRILDEQEQDDVIRRLKEANKASNIRSLTIVQGILVSSAVLQICSCFRNPLLSVIPPGIPDVPVDIPLPLGFTFLNLILHANLTLVAFRDEIRAHCRVSDGFLHPLPYQLSYAIAAVPPTLSIFLGRPWQSTGWWSLTVIIVFVVQTVSLSINEGNEGISELEQLRYVAPGA